MTITDRAVAAGDHRLTEGEFEEMHLLGLLDENGTPQPSPPSLRDLEIERIPRKAIEAHDVLNEAYTYTLPAYRLPASFTRGLRIPLGETTLLLISGTASVDERGKTIHVGDFRAQCWRTYRNITRLLESEEATWHDVVRCTCYLRDMERDYDDFNQVRTQFFTWLGLDPLPASTGIQARLCREDLLVEIEAIAMIPSNRSKR
jgi:enamine deaminase RidA (YjgF/YER057c/UK114 family)